MASTHQLAEIMFTDIVGFTALMGKDSDKALELICISKEDPEATGGEAQYFND